MELLPLEKAHLALLERWRKVMDLVGPGPLEPHFEDAARAVSALETQPGQLWADLGSGAGFPGVALAARHPELRVQLVESRQKRAAFLRLVGAGEVLCVRVESLPSGIYDGVVSRAFRPPEHYLEDALRLLRPGGTALLMLARQAPPTLPGLEMFHVEHYTLGERPRSAARYRKL